MKYDIHCMHLYEVEYALSPYISRSKSVNNQTNIFEIKYNKIHKRKFENLHNIIIIVRSMVTLEFFIGIISNESEIKI